MERNDLKVWYELGEILPDESTHTIESYDNLKDAIMGLADHEGDHYFIDTWYRPQGEESYPIDSTELKKTDVNEIVEYFLANRRR